MGEYDDFGYGIDGEIVVSYFEQVVGKSDLELMD